MIELVPKYKVQLIEDEKGRHNYQINDDKTYFPGVTTILDQVSKPALVAWAAKETALYMSSIMKKLASSDRFLKEHFFDNEKFMELWVKRSKKQPKFIKEKAAKIGSSVHKIIDVLIKEPTAQIKVTNPEIDTVVQSFKLWASNEKLKIEMGDTAIASLEYAYGGSLDFLAFDEKTNKIKIGDFKTSNSLYDSHSFQVAAYCQGAKETYGLDYLPEAVLIRFGKSKVEYERREVNNPSLAFQGFKAALDLYKLKDCEFFNNKETIRPSKIKKEKK